MQYATTLKIEEPINAINLHRLLPSTDDLHDKVDRVNHIVTVEQRESLRNFNELYRQRVHRDLAKESEPLITETTIFDEVLEYLNIKMKLIYLRIEKIILE